jgi:hypothetical protein
MVPAGGTNSLSNSDNAYLPIAYLDLQGIDVRGKYPMRNLELLNDLESVGRAVGRDPVSYPIQPM